MDKDFKGLFGESDDEPGDEPADGRGNASSFMQHYGWIYQAELVADFERISLEEAYEIKTINFLNDLVYLKAKAEHEAQLFKKAYGKVN